MRVLLIDTQEVFREGLALALRLDYGFDVEHSSSLDDAAPVIRSNLVDVAVMTCDVRVQTANEFDRALHAFDPATPVLILAERATDMEGQALGSGRAAGLVLKRDPINVLADAIHRVAQGGILYAPFPG